MSTTITVSAEERQLILEQMWQWTGGDDPVAFDTRDQAVETLERLQRALGVYDELGWDHDGRSEFTLTVTPQLVQLMTDAQRNSAEAVELERANREKSKIDPYGWGFGGTMEENLLAYDKMIEREEWEAARFASVLARIDAQTVTA